MAAGVLVDVVVVVGDLPPRARGVLEDRAPRGRVRDGVLAEPVEEQRLAPIGGPRSVDEVLPVEEEKEVLDAAPLEALVDGGKQVARDRPLPLPDAVLPAQPVPPAPRHAARAELEV